MTPEILLVTKIVTSVVMVLGLTLVAEYVSPRVAGVLSGYPLGVAIALFFIGVENGAGFAATSAVYTLAGFTASLVMVAIYYGASQQLGVFWSSVVAVAGFMLVATLLRQFSFTLISGVLLTLSAMAVAIYGFRQIANIKVGTRVQFSLGVMAVRAGAATAIVLLITGLAGQVGEAWAGVLSAFPITLFPFLVILHITYGGAQVHTVIKNFPLGMGSLLAYTATVAMTYPQYGVGWGTVFGFASATIYLATLGVWSSRRKG